MRKKFAMKLRREVLRRGAEIQSEGLVFSKKELREQNLKRSDNGYSVKALYEGFKLNVADDDMLKTYRFLLWCMDAICEDKKKDEENGVCTIGGTWLGDTGRADWIAG